MKNQAYRVQINTSEIPYVEAYPLYQEYMSKILEQLDPDLKLSKQGDEVIKEYIAKLSDDKCVSIFAVLLALQTKNEKSFKRLSFYLPFVIAMTILVLLNNMFQFEFINKVISIPALGLGSQVALIALIGIIFYFAYGRFVRLKATRLVANEGFRLIFQRIKRIQDDKIVISNMD